MDGKKLLKEFLDCLDEDEHTDTYAEKRRGYECLDQAASIFCRETRILHTEVDITTVENEQEYDLPPDFIDLYMKNRQGRFFTKFYNGSNYSWPLRTTYEKIFKTNITDSKDIPSRFCITDKLIKEDLIQGAADADGPDSQGQCILQDDTMLFTTTNKVYPRDVIHNETDKSDGYVLSVTDAIHLVAALFDGTDDDWTIADTFTIQPAAEKQLVLDQPSKTAGYVITVPYICMPSPVFSYYGFWRFPPQVCKAIAAGAASIFKIPKREFKESDEIGGLFAAEITRVRREIAQARLQGLQGTHYRERY